MEKYVKIPRQCHNDEAPQHSGGTKRTNKNYKTNYTYVNTGHKQRTATKEQSVEKLLGGLKPVLKIHVVSTYIQYKCPEEEFLVSTDNIHFRHRGMDR